MPETVLCAGKHKELSEELARRHSTLIGLKPFQAQARFVALLQDMLYYGVHFFKVIQVIRKIKNYFSTKFFFVQKFN